MGRVCVLVWLMVLDGICTPDDPTQSFSSHWMFSWNSAYVITSHSWPGSPVCHFSASQSPLGSQEPHDGALHGPCWDGCRLLWLHTSSLPCKVEWPVALGSLIQSSSLYLGGVTEKFPRWDLPSSVLRRMECVFCFFFKNTYLLLLC